MRKTLTLGLAFCISILQIGAASANTSIVFKGRTINVYHPSNPSAGLPKGLVLLLHGYGGTGKQINDYLQFKQIAKQANVIYVTVEGTKDSSGKQFWNATSSCCNFSKKKIDEVTYFKELIQDLQRQNSVDPQRIFIIGHSNGGFMAHSLACSLSPIVAGIISIAGEQAQNADDCKPDYSVNILQIQGMADLVVPYSGGNLGLGPFPGAEATLKMWATKNSCDLAKFEVKEIPTLVYLKPSTPSLSKSYASCPIGGSVELWAIPRAGHVPIFNLQGQRQIANWINTHPGLVKTTTKYNPDDLSD